MHLELPRAAVSIQIKFLFHIYNFLLSHPVCTIFFPSRSLRPSAFLSLSHQLFLSRLFFPPLPFFSPFVSAIFFCRDSSCHSRHLFPFHQISLADSCTDLSKLFLPPSKHPLLTTEREGRGHRGKGCKMPRGITFSIKKNKKKPLRKLWPQFPNNRSHFHAAVRFHHKTSSH